MEKDFYADSIVRDTTPYYADEQQRTATEVKEEYYKRNSTGALVTTALEAPEDRFDALETLQQTIADMRQSLNVLEALAADIAGTRR